jgi:tape measure domain-containing protein
VSEDAVAYVSVIPVAKGAGKSIAAQVDAENPGGMIGASVSSGFLSKVGGIGLGLVKAVTGAVAVSGGLLAGLALKGGLDRVLNIQDAQAKLKGLGHDTETVTKIMDSALASVKGTAFGLDSAATIAASAISAGIKPGEELTRYLSLTADSATIAGTSLAEMGSIWGKVATSGKLTGEVVNQFQDRGIPILQLVADQYGITADAASEMVSRGEVDFATFQNAIEAGMGGAALKSGAAVAGAPALFTSISNAVDRAGAALKPYADMFSAWLIPAMAELGTRIDTIDFGKIVSGIQAIYDLVVKGDFTSQFREAFNLTEDSTTVAVILNIRDAIVWLLDAGKSLYEFFSTGLVYQSMLDTFNVQPTSTFVDILYAIRDGAIGVFEAFKTGDFSSLGSSFSTIGSAATPLFPIFVGVAKGLGEVATNIGGLIAAGIPLLAPIIDTLTGALGFLADNSELIAPLIATLAGAFVLYKTAQAAANVAALASIPLDVARIASTFALAAAQNRLATQMAITNGVEKAGFLTRVPVVVQWLAQTAAMVANLAVQGAMKVALLAGAVATGVAAAAQWAWNAAMSANPIGIIVLAIAALVAGLIWFFTQTELGKEIWANVSAFFVTVWTAISDFFIAVWNNMASFFTTVWEIIVAVATAYINLVLGVITAVVNFIVDVWTNVWNGITSFFTGVWQFIVAVATAYVQMVLSVISGVINAISSVWNSVWSGISSFFGGIWNTIIDTVSRVGSVFGDVFNSVAGVVKGAFEGVVSIVKGVINGIIDAVNGVIGGINGVAGAIGGAIGVNLNIGKIPRLAEGGIVSARPGGIVANIGEGRYDEAVVPLSPKILDTLSGGDDSKRGGDTFILQELTNIAALVLQIQRRQNGATI